MRGVDHTVRAAQRTHVVGNFGGQRVVVVEVLVVNVVDVAGIAYAGEQKKKKKKKKKNKNKNKK